MDSVKKSAVILHSTHPHMKNFPHLRKLMISYEFKFGLLMVLFKALAKNETLKFSRNFRLKFNRITWLESHNSALPQTQTVQRFSKKRGCFCRSIAWMVRITSAQLNVMCWSRYWSCRTARSWAIAMKLLARASAHVTDWTKNQGSKHLFKIHPHWVLFRWRCKML